MKKEKKKKSRPKFAEALTKQETESGKKIEKSDSVMQFHPRGKVGKYHTILPQKC